MIFSVSSSNQCHGANVWPAFTQTVHHMRCSTELLGSDDVSAILTGIPSKNRQRGTELYWASRKRTMSLFNNNVPFDELF